LSTGSHSTAATYVPVRFPVAFTVGGETNFDAAYNDNILVNAMTVGLVDVDKIFYSAAKGVGNPIVYVGSKTGRDGIHGATMASAEFDEASEEKRPTVQVGDPFTEKLLLEACLELMAEDAIIAIQDMGAAGLTSSSVEMGAKGGVGVALDLDRVPQREAGMTAYEMMLSESQERMLMVLRPGAEPRAVAIFEKWGLDIAVIGETTDTNRLVLTHKGETVADLPLAPLADEAPNYDRPAAQPQSPAPFDPAALPAAPAPLKALARLMAAPDLASRRWIWEQYDYSVMGDTIQPPGGDAGVVRVHGTKKAIAITTDVTPRYCAADPVEGGKQAVAEAYRNLIAVGARPLAITNCLNFGNPERPEIMGQFVGCIEGMTEACRALDFPVVSGNVSLYNETNGAGIPPTPAIGGVGLIDDYARMRRMDAAGAEMSIVLLGETRGALGQSLYLREVFGRAEGAPPPVDLVQEKRAGAFIRHLLARDFPCALHDVSDGGALVAVAEMALAAGVGAALATPAGADPAAFWFGEDQGRYILALDTEFLKQLKGEAKEHGVAATELGAFGGDVLALDGAALALNDLREAHERALPALMGAT